ncbi:putative quinate permease AltName: Full=Quinate transporter [Rhizoctonia solani AG-1 IB]|uniref:Quinate transporter n=1 Tax=Thanatephorus cucumeris (strain AG1-IB / isolate 7/3/14) TaxID=1108050 RepID=M5CEV0_THACB|nr:putative quinate permease AltName: Full=Quinate transporter [Rhizoctonia solani AG-1 IB]
MTLKIVEDRPTPKEVYNWRPYALALVAAWGGVLFGYDSAFIGGTLALPSFSHQFGLDKMSTSEKSFTSANIVSTYQGGCFFGAILGLFVAEKWGRRATLLGASALFCLGAGLMLGATNSLGIFYAGRIIGGFGVGAVSLATPLYIAEISPPSIRGRLVGFYETLLQIGGVVGFWINYGVNLGVAPTAKQWHIPVSLQLIPGGILLVAAVFLKETPRWLFKAGREEEAVKNLSWIRNLPHDHQYVRQEIQATRSQLDREMALVRDHGFIGQVRELGKPGIRNRLGVGMAIMMFQNLTGINAINYYSPTIFKSIGITGTNNGLFATGIYGIVKMVTTFVFLFWLIDLVGRRKPLIYGSIGGSFSMFYIAAFIAIAQPKEGDKATAAGRFAVACLYIFAISFCASWNGISWIVCAEIFPLGVRALCCAITTATQWLWQFVIARSTPYMVANIGYGTYLFFGVCMVLMIPWVIFALPETKGVSLEDMDELFGYVAPGGDQARRASPAGSINDEQKGDVVHEEVVNPSADRNV